MNQTLLSWLRWRLPVGVCLLFLLACSASKPVAPAPAPVAYGPAVIEQEIAASEEQLQRFVGFALYDPELDSMVVAHHADKYFVPASNTKLYTFYTCLKMLGDSIPALKYAVHGDSLLFWGTGDPTFTHMDVKNSVAYDFLKNRPEKLYYLDAPFASTPFATNWGWDDYNYYYQPERDVFPIHGNVVKFTRHNGGDFTVTPAYFRPLVKTDTSANDNEDTFVRAWRSNDITYYPRYAKASYSYEVPYITSPQITAALLADTLKRPVTWVQRSIPQDAQTFYGLPADTVYQRMLQVSDNLLAEQLMALCSGTLSDTISVRRGIKYALAHYLNDLPDTPVWVDGSGLSSMDLFTPRDMIAILQKLLQERPKERLFPLLAAGGRPGTFRNLYKADEPFVYAKSGTLSHVHNQSGYILTKSGKLLLYSFMNNNFSEPTSEIRNEMERIVTEIHNKY